MNKKQIEKKIENIEDNADYLFAKIVGFYLYTIFIICITSKINNSTLSQIHFDLLFISVFIGVILIIFFVKVFYKRSEINYLKNKLKYEEE